MVKKNPQNLSEIQNRLYEIYHNEIAPLMIDWEKKRKSEVFKFVFILVVVIIAISVCVYLFAELRNIQALFFIGIGTAVSACYFLYNINEDFSRKLKRECMPQVVKAFGKMKWYENSHKLSTSKINESELFSNFNQRTDDDVFVGKYKGVEFSVTETRLWYLSGSGKNKVTYTIFKGVIINFASNKDIINKTMIATKGDWNIKNRHSAIFMVLLMLLPSIVMAIFNGDSFTPEELIKCVLVWLAAICAFVCYVLFNSKKNKEKLNEIKLEDVEFNKYYKAYSSDEVEGRYLITTAFMERFKNLQTAFGARKAKCSFYGEDIMFAISTRKNLFEIGSLFTPLNSSKQLEKAFEELSSILALIDYFKLDEKTGL